MYRLNRRCSLSGVPLYCYVECKLGSNCGRELGRSSLGTHRTHASQARWSNHVPRNPICQTRQLRSQHFLRQGQSFLPLSRHPVNVRRTEMRVAHQRQFIVTRFIRLDVDDVWFSAATGRWLSPVCRVIWVKPHGCFLSTKKWASKLSWRCPPWYAALCRQI